MKEFKNDQNLENDKIEEFENKKFEEDLAEIKQKLNAEKLSDEFKENLINKLENELNKDNNEIKDSSNNKGKVIKFPVITRKLAGICACFIFLFTSCFAFADEIESVFGRFFSNTDKVIERAIANGNYKEIDMDYVTDNGVSIKVDYIISEEECLYIAFNVKNEEEFDKIMIEDIEIKNQNNELLYERKDDELKSSFNIEKSFINSKNISILYKITDFNEINKEIKKLIVEIEKIYLKKDEEYIVKDGNWYLNI